MLTLKNINKYYNKNKTNQIHVLNNINIDLGNQGMVAILGASGSGKTTLLNALCGLDKVDSGTITIDNKQINRYKSHAWDDIRNEYFGYIFQNYNLFGDQTVFQNVSFSLEMLGIKDPELIKTRTLEALEAVQMAKYKNRLAKNLSGGEQQRVAIARAIVKDAKVIIADEPTGNLDQKNTIRIMNILREIAKTKLVIMVTHQKPLAHVYADRIINLSDGQVINDSININEEGITISDERIVYLNDMPHQQKLNDGSLSLFVYSDSDLKDDKLNIKLIVRGKNIYLMPDTNYHVELLQKDSLIQVVEGSKEDDVRENFDMPLALGKLTVPSRKRYNLSLIRYFKKGFQELMVLSKIKKLLLFGFVFSSLLLTITIGLYQNVINVNEDEFMYTNRDVVLVTKPISDSEREEVFNTQTGLAGVYGFASTVQNPQMTVESFYQTAYFKEGFDQYLNLLGTVVNYKAVKNYQGVEPSPGEIVIDQLVINRLFSDRYSAINMSEKMILGQKITIGGQTYKIKAITNLNNLAIYATPFDALIVNIPFYDVPIYDINQVSSNITYLQKGEILVSNKNFRNLKIDDKYTINNHEYTVKGFFVDEGKNEGVVFSLEDLSLITFEQISKYHQYYLLSTNPDTTALSIDKSGNYAEAMYQKAYKSYQENRMVIFKVLFSFIAIMLVTPLLMLYFMMRSNMIARIKEIGIYRALGLTKLNIYKMHLGEILAITALFSLSGYLLAMFIMYQANRKGVLQMFKLDLITVLGSLFVIVLINILVGLIPIFRLMRKTPREILSKYDI